MCAVAEPESMTILVRPWADSKGTCHQRRLARLADGEGGPRWPWGALLGCLPSFPNLPSSFSAEGALGERFLRGKREISTPSTSLPRLDG